ncbi:MAG TPA: trypsin-like peptidase domain-containing protein [Ktedonobacterales bacterium]
MADGRDAVSANVATATTSAEPAISPIALAEATARLAEQARASVAQAQVGSRGIGSAIIWEVDQPDATGESEATIITNAHVVAAGRSERLTLRLHDGREIEARLVAIDPEHDLAALRTRARDLRAAPIGDSGALRIGEYVMAIGNPFGIEDAVTMGVVAAQSPADPDLELEPALPPDAGWPGRRFARVELVQVDIRLYPGNSGGPLFDARGRVIGVNAMVGGGLGFAIPSNTVGRFLDETGRTGQRAYLGVQAQTVPLSPVQRERAGVPHETVPLIIAVEADGPAEAAGILVGDALLAVDGRLVRSAEQLVRLLNRAGTAGQQRTLEALRGGQRITILLTPVLRAAA